MRNKYVLMAEAPETPPGGETPPAAPTPPPAAPSTPPPAPVTPPETPPAVPPTTPPTPPATPPAPPEIKLELPKDSKLHQSDIDRIAATARERGLTQEQATALLTEADTAARGYENRLNETAAAKRTEWVAKVKADPELGGANLETTNRNAMRVVERFMSPALREELRITGYGDHPELVRFLAKVGASMAEDTPGEGQKPTFNKRTPEDVLYGTPNS